MSITVDPQSAAPRFANESRQSIVLNVQLPGMGQAVEFHATPDDEEPHGRELYARALAGEFGPVADPHPPVPVPERSIEEKLASVGLTLDELAAALARR